MKSLLKKSILLFSVLLIIGCTPKENVSNQETPATEEQTMELSEKTFPENNGIETIKKFYQHITDGDLKKAHDMYIIKKVGFQTFTEWYGNTEYAIPVNFKKTGENSYEYVVNFEDKEDDPQIFKVLAETEDGKLQTLSSTEIHDRVSYNDELSVHIDRSLKRSQVILTEDGKETIIKEAPKDWDKFIGESYSFVDPAFSPNGRYFTYVGLGWEWYNGWIYDRETKKSTQLTSPFHKGFTKNEKYFFACANDHFSGDTYAKIYQLPEVREIYDVYKVNPKNEVFAYLDCEFDEENQKLYMNLRDWDEIQKKIVEYDFSTESDQIVPNSVWEEFQKIPFGGNW
jgi:hypothetical protein